MNRTSKLEALLKKAEPELRKRCAAANEMATDIGKQMIHDQIEWLDKQMKDILPPNLYAEGRELDKKGEVAAYAKKHGIRVVFIPDSLRIRIMIKDRVHSEFVPQFTVDGELVEFKPTRSLDGQQN